MTAIDASYTRGSIRDESVVDPHCDLVHFSSGEKRLRQVSLALSPSDDLPVKLPEETGKSGYDHLMLTEIHEQPRAPRQCLRGRVDELRGTVDVGDLADLSPPAVQLVAAGTSYHASLYAAAMLQAAGVPAQAFLSHEYAIAPPPIGDALVVGVSQSGETADTLAALREADRRGPARWR